MSQWAMLAGWIALSAVGFSLDLAGYQDTRLASALLIAALLLFVYWLIDAFRYLLNKRSSARSAAWANRDRIELYDAACRMAGKPPNAPFSQEPQRSYHRRLKDAINDGDLVVLDMRGREPNEKTLVTRDALRVYARRARWPELSELLREWDRLNLPTLEVSGIPELPLKL